MQNIFNSSSDIKRDLRIIYYDLLKSRQGVTYEMVFKSFLKKVRVEELENSVDSDGEEEIRKIEYSIEEEFQKFGYEIDRSVYNAIKKVIPSFNKDMIKMGYRIIASGGKNTSYTLETRYSDPLQQWEKESIYERYVEIFAEKIQLEWPVRLTYKPFDKDEMSIIFHPHHLRNYAGKWFVIGVSEKEGHSTKRFVVAIDRIRNLSKVSKSHRYIAPLPNEYDYLHDIIGVYKEDKPVMKIRLKAIDRNTHGKLVSNPLHSSQEVLPDRDYGIVELNVIPNGELRALILSYGSKLKVIEPQEFKAEIQEEIRKMINCYE